MKIGYIPTRRNNFSVEAALFYKKKIRQIIEVISPEIVDLEDINSEGLLWKQADVPKVIEKMRREQVDALFFPHCNFGSEGVVGQVAAALNVPVLLYGPRDDAPALDGMRDRDSQCGLFATGKVLRHHNVTFTYITNVAPDDMVFISGYEKFLRVVQVVKTVRNIRILQIGPRPTDFLSVMANEAELMELFGVEVYPLTLSELKSEMERCWTEERKNVEDVCTWIEKNYQGVGAKEEVPRRTFAKMKVAIQNLAKKFQCNCACIQCWSAMQDELDIFPCAVNSMLADEGFPVACETDICGAISALLIQAATGNKKVHFLIEKAAEITAMQEAYSYLTTKFEFRDEMLDDVLALENPLKYFADRWLMPVSDVFDVDMDIRENIAGIRDSQEYLCQREPAVSVLARLQNAAQEVRECPAVEKPVRDFGAR